MKIKMLMALALLCLPLTVFAQSLVILDEGYNIDEDLDASSQIISQRCNNTFLTRGDPATGNTPAKLRTGSLCTLFPSTYLGQRQQNKTWAQFENNMVFKVAFGTSNPVIVEFPTILRRTLPNGDEVKIAHGNWVVMLPMTLTRQSLKSLIRFLV